MFGTPKVALLVMVNTDQSGRCDKTWNEITAVLKPIHAWIIIYWDSVSRRLSAYPERSSQAGYILVQACYLQMFAWRLGSSVLQIDWENWVHGNRPMNEKRSASTFNMVYAACPDCFSQEYSMETAYKRAEMTANFDRGRTERIGTKPGGH